MSMIILRFLIDQLTKLKLLKKMIECCPSACYRLKQKKLSNIMYNMPEISSLIFSRKISVFYFQTQHYIVNKQCIFVVCLHLDFCFTCIFIIMLDFLYFIYLCHWFYFTLPICLHLFLFLLFFLFFFCSVWIGNNGYGYSKWG